MRFEEFLKQKYGINTPIYISEIEFENYSRSWIYMQIKKLVDTSILKQFDRGIYYFPVKMSFGESCLDPRDVVERRFISDGKNSYGYVAGLSLLNSIGLTTQMPNLVEIVTNNESARIRDIDVGSQRVRARRARTNINNENVEVLQFLDLMSNLNSKNMEETERFMLSKYVNSSGVTQSQIVQYANLYPAKAMKNLMESGVINELTHG